MGGDRTESTDNGRNVEALAARLRICCDGHGKLHFQECSSQLLKRERPAQCGAFTVCLLADVFNDSYIALIALALATTNISLCNAITVLKRADILGFPSTSSNSGGACGIADLQTWKAG